MDVARSGTAHPRDDGLPAWALPVFLVVAVVACALLLRFAIGVMDDEAPATTPTSASLTATASP